LLRAAVFLSEGRSFRWTGATASQDGASGVDLICDRAIRRLKYQLLTLKNLFSTRSPALPGNADRSALPPIFLQAIRGRASGHRFPGRAGEAVNR
jgi:hypothetical protein